MVPTETVAMTTEENNDVIRLTTTIDPGTSSMLSDGNFYVRCAVVVIGVLGTAGNALILYALVASKQHRKHLLIFHQNVFDLFGSLALIASYVAKLCFYNAHFSGVVGYLLCSMIINDCILWWGIIGSKINLVSITVERYLKVVYPTRSKKWVSKKTLHAAVALAWIISIVYNTTFTLLISAAINGQCVFQFNAAVGILNFAAFSAILLAIFTFCYGRIFIAIRRQARVMAGHTAAGSSAGQTRSNKIKTNVIKSMLAVTVMFAVTNMPLDLLLMLNTLNIQLPLYLYDPCTFAVFVYICINPFVYATKFDPVKKALLGLIPCKQTSVQPQPAGIPRCVELRPTDC